MSRRSGKAASRRARQQRRARHAAASGPSPAPAVVAPTPSAKPAAASGRPYPGSASIAGSSRLGEAARAEYHYVARDLRNTGLLVLLMAALLGVAVVVVNLAGIGPS